MHHSHSSLWYSVGLSAMRPFVADCISLYAECVSKGRLHTPGLDGIELCDEPSHRNGGPSTPLYNYASASLFPLQPLSAYFSLNLCLLWDSVCVWWDRAALLCR